MKFLDAESEKFLAQLVRAFGISGNTHEVSQVIEARLRASGVEILPDPTGLGFLQMVLNPAPAFRVLLSTHMDTVGFRITHVDSKGFCYFRPVGGVDPLTLKGHRVRILTKVGLVKGLIQGYPIHHQDPEKRDQKVSWDALYLRTEFTGLNPDDAPIRVGDPVAFDSQMEPLGENFLMGPGFFDRLGVFLMIELFRRLKPGDLKVALYGVASPGEEIGCRGIRALTQKLEPALAIVLDVTSATDYPGADKRKFGSQAMGHGPIIAVGYNTRTPFNEKLLVLAEECGIPVQLRAEDLTPTDGRETDEAGVATLVVRVPGSMLHTPHDVVERGDIELTGRLIYEFLKRLPN